MCVSVSMPKRNAKATAAAKEGEYAQYALQASPGTYPYLPGVAVVHVAVAEEVVLEGVEEVVAVGMFVEM